MPAAPLCLPHAALCGHSARGSPPRRRFVTGLRFYGRWAAPTIGGAPGSSVLARPRGVSATSLIGGQMGQPLDQQRPSKLARLARLAGASCLWLAATTTAVATTRRAGPGSGSWKRGRRHDLRGRPGPGWLRHLNVVAEQHGPRQLQ